MSGTNDLDPVLRVLIGVRDRLKEPAAWCQDSLGSSDGPNCLLGALYVIDVGSLEPVSLSDVGQRAAEALMDAIGSRSIATFNNTRTHPEVLEAIDKAIASKVRV